MHPHFNVHLAPYVLHCYRNWHLPVQSLHLVDLLLHLGLLLRQLLQHMLQIQAKGFNLFEVMSLNPDEFSVNLQPHFLG